MMPDFSTWITVTRNKGDRSVATYADSEGDRNHTTQRDETADLMMTSNGLLNKK